jgi:hypothetical protein
MYRHKNQYGVYCEGEALRRGTPAKELEPTVADRLGVDKGDG